MRKQLVIFHGDGADSSCHWIPSTKKYFEDKGWHVVSPSIPDSDKPDLHLWSKYVKSKFEMTADTVLVGHSSGCPLIISLVEDSTIRIKKAVLVGGFIEDIGHGVKPLLKDSYNWERIKSNCEEFYFLNSQKDPFGCDDKQGRLMLDKLGGTQIVVSKPTHFGASDLNDFCTDLPLLIKLIED